MKKLILVALAVSSIATAQAQKPGSLLVYGDFGVGGFTEKNDDGIVGTDDVKNKQFYISFVPGIGYQFNYNWTVGVNLGLGHTRQSSSIDNSDVVRSTFYLAGPFVRMTTPLNKTFFLFHQLNVHYIGSKGVVDHASPITDEEVKTRGVGLNLFPAVGVNFTKCIALNFSFGGLGFGWERETNNIDASEITRSGIDFTMGRQINLGISANLGGKNMKGHREPGMEHRRHMEMDEDGDTDIKVKKKKVRIEEED